MSSLRWKSGNAWSRSPVVPLQTSFCKMIVDSRWSVTFIGHKGAIVVYHAKRDLDSFVSFVRAEFPSFPLLGRFPFAQLLNSAWKTDCPTSDIGIWAQQSSCHQLCTHTHTVYFNFQKIETRKHRCFLRLVSFSNGQQWGADKQDLSDCNDMRFCSLPAHVRLSLVAGIVLRAARCVLNPCMNTACRSQETPHH